MVKKKFQWEAESGEPRDAPPEPRHRGRQKREAKSVEDLIDRLLALPPGLVSGLPISEDTAEHLEILRGLLARGGVRSGLRRQRLAVAGALREEDTDALRAAMSDGDRPSDRDLALQQLERVRARLVRDGDDAVDALCADHPSADRPRLRALVRQARKEADSEEGPGRAHKKLFAALRELHGL